MEWPLKRVSFNKSRSAYCDVNESRKYLPMKTFRIFRVLSIAVALWYLEASCRAATTDPGDPSTPTSGKFWMIPVGFTLVGCLFAFSFIRQSLAASNWSIADALSEEVEISDPQANQQTPPNPPNKVTVLRASVSRLIALVGMFVIVFLFLGFGIVLVKTYAESGTAPKQGDVESIRTFLLAGMTLFAPYLVNKFSGIFGQGK